MKKHLIATSSINGECLEFYLIEGINEPLGGSMTVNGVTTERIATDRLIVTDGNEELKVCDYICTKGDFAVKIVVEGIVNFMHNYSYKLFTEYGRQFPYNIRTSDQPVSKKAFDFYFESKEAKIRAEIEAKMQSLATLKDNKKKGVINS